MAKNWFWTNAVALAQLQAAAAAIDAGTAAVINIYSGTVPLNADAALAGNTLLAQLVCSPTFFSGYTDTGTAARGAIAAITPDASADASGTATFFRVLTQSGGTVCGQGTVGTTDSDLILNTVAITAGSQVAVTSGTIDQPEG